MLHTSYIIGDRHRKSKQVEGEEEANRNPHREASFRLLHRRSVLRYVLQTAYCWSFIFPYLRDEKQHYCSLCSQSQETNWHRPHQQAALSAGFQWVPMRITGRLDSEVRVLTPPPASLRGSTGWLHLSAKGLSSPLHIGLLGLSPGHCPSPLDQGW